jgi:glycosyltransferase involved in cell wall biosynthesis
VGEPQVTLSIVVPTLDEADGIVATLSALAPLRQRGHQVIVVDGGSRDRTVALARDHADTVIEAARGRARQMNAGAAVASGDVLLFLHADTTLPPDADRLVAHALAAGSGGRRGSQQGPGLGVGRGHGDAWGRFDVRIDGRSPMLAVVAALMNLRSRGSGIATGDQAIFVRRDAFDAVGGFPDQPLMEDVELCRRLRRIGPPACLRARVSTSGRRWEARGVWRTILLMWWLRWRYWRGESADVLARQYR